MTGSTPSIRWEWKNIACRTMVVCFGANPVSTIYTAHVVADITTIPNPRIIQGLTG